MMYMETSALDTSNVESAFQSVLSEICRVQLSHDAETSASSPGPMKMTERHLFDI